MSSPGRCVRVRTEVAAIEKLLDYVVPATWRDEVGVGTRVRVPLHGRSVRGWVVEDDVTPSEGVELLPLKSWLGWGPPPALVDLSEWAAWRWAGPASFFLKVASPLPVVRALPGPPRLPPSTAAPGGRLGGLLDQVAPVPGTTVLRLAPSTDLIDLVLAVADSARTAAQGGSVLVLVPSVGWADRLARRLNRRGYPAATEWAQARAGWTIVVGSRAAAWAPLPHLAAAVVLDAHDTAYREQSAPTYSAVDVVAERARREGSACYLTSPVPPVVVSQGRAVVALPAVEERAGWATLECVDRRGADPRTGMFSEEFVTLARAVLDDPAAGAGGPLICVYNRKGRARLLACSHCGELARCTTCGAAMSQQGDGLHCARCGGERPMVCAACGRLRMKTLRAGVSRLREELAALLGVEVGEVTGNAPPGDLPDTPVLIGTEAVLHRARHASAVAFLDIDLHLLAPRFDAPDETLALLVRASRLVGPRRAGPAWARVQAQTRAPDHPVLVAVGRGEPAAVLAGEEAIRRSSGLPPFSALALISGTLAPRFAAAVEEASPGTGVSVAQMGEGSYLIRAPDHGALGDLLAAVPRPPGRGLRVEVDPTAL
jgi:primosomal protein N' (replication factor Y)